MGKESLVVGGVLCLWEVENSSWVIFWLCRVGKGGGGIFMYVGEMTFTGGTVSLT